MKLDPHQQDANTSSLDALLQSKGLDAGDLITAIEAIAKIKQRDADKAEKEQSRHQDKQKKIFVDKEFVYKLGKTFLYTKMAEQRVEDTMSESMIQEQRERTARV